MNLFRRNFLKAAVVVVAAPAIVKAENIMKIWVPPERTVITYTPKNKILIHRGNHDAADAFAYSVDLKYKTIAIDTGEGLDVGSIAWYRYDKLEDKFVVIAQGDMS